MNETRLTLDPGAKWLGTLSDVREVLDQLALEVREQPYLYLSVYAVRNAQQSQRIVSMCPDDLGKGFWLFDKDVYVINTRHRINDHEVGLFPYPLTPAANRYANQWLRRVASMFMEAWLNESDYLPTNK